MNLKPCPFCGGSAASDFFIPLESICQAYCLNPKCHLHEPIGITPEEWNTRPEFKFEDYKTWWGTLPFGGKKTYSAEDGFNAAHEMKEAGE